MEERKSTAEFIADTINDTVENMDEREASTLIYLIMAGAVKSGDHSLIKWFPGFRYVEFKLTWDATVRLSWSDENDGIISIPELKEGEPKIWADIAKTESDGSVISCYDLSEKAAIRVFLNCPNCY